MKLIALGECMLEFSSIGASQYQLGFGGDTLNTAIYLARCGGLVDYLTALGDDHLSTGMIQAWQQEGIGIQWVMRKSGALPGLYLIETDAQGERKFHYWRQSAPARTVLEDWPELLEKLMPYEYFYLSGITLSLYTDAVLERLWAFLDVYRAKGGKVVFDINFRPAGWPDAERKQAVFAAMLPRVDIALTGFDDEIKLYGEHTKEECLARYRNAGVQEIVIKDGANGCLLHCNQITTPIPVPSKIMPVDTTAAGDSFNGAYLAARLQNCSPQSAVAIGQACAGLVIQHRGAIVALEIFQSEMQPIIKKYVDSIQ